MKKIFGLLAILSIMFAFKPVSLHHKQSVLALDTVKTVTAIKAKYSAIEAKRKSYSQYIPADRKEGLLYIGFYEGQSLKMVNMNIYGDSGKTESDQYLDETGIIMIFAKVFEYETPLSVNPRSAAKSMTENWYYFSNGTLIKWVSGGKVKPAGSAEFKKKQAAFKEELPKTKKQFSNFATLKQIKQGL